MSAIDVGVPCGVEGVRRSFLYQQTRACITESTEVTLTLGSCGEILFIAGLITDEAYNSVAQEKEVTFWDKN